MVGGWVVTCVAGVLKREIDGATKPVALIDVSMPNAINDTQNSEDKK